MNQFEHSPLLQQIAQNSQKYASKPAIIMNGQSITYSELFVNIRKAAGVMKQMGFKAGDRIILSAHKDLEYLYLYFASHILGIINVIVDSESNEERLQYIEERIQPVCCFGYKSKKFNSKLFSELNIDEGYEIESTCDILHRTSIAEILFTTGTTGLPKGVCLSYYNIYSSAENINGYIGNSAEDVELLALPICHSFGMGRIRCALIKGSTIVILNNFANIRAFLKAFELYHITGFGLVPAAWAYIRKMSGMRIAKYAKQIHYIEIGSASMSLDTKKELLNLFPDTRICMHYGLTEASRCCFQEFHDTKHLDSIGKPVSSLVDIKVMDEHGNELPVNSKGELCVKGNMVFSHYLEECDTKNAFYNEYFRTGDCGYKNSEGYFYLLGREKELINVGGKKVSPMEVEDAIISLGVGDCVCVPIKDETNFMGELVFCYVLKGSTSLTFEEIAEKLKSKLEVYKRPVAYAWIDKIPITSSGKKQRIQIK
ncbi:class I adenylate-forming enzyme family protein [Bacteroides sp. OF04-15BH]|uniref:class I adenylate-forming enzyme family protein n=1 Tax=Bacteroides sp. OF04-15BH TaxID=2292281 RepID=UPI000E532172|nr:class I adenylate-forming enzyme family protein [Bacteroides sp. OF04-15BH]RHP66416.1 long-chain fatty acid--CoA ligase [Bacteroides sp. OF04-15BH]